MYEASLTWLRTMVLLPLDTFMIGLLACQSVQKKNKPTRMSPACDQHVIIRRSHTFDTNVAFY